MLRAIYGNGYNRFELRYPLLDDTVQISIVGQPPPDPRVMLITPAGRELIDRARYGWFFFEAKQPDHLLIDVAFEPCSGRAVGVLDPSVRLDLVPLEKPQKEPAPATSP